MARSYVFRLSAEGWEELRQQLTAIGPAGQQAIDAVTAKVPQLQNALNNAERSADSARTKLTQMSTASTGLAGSLGITARQAQQLTPQLNDVITQVASGTPIFQVFTQQGGQIVQALGGMGATAGVARTAFSALLGPVGLGIAAFGALATALILARDNTESLAEATERHAKEQERAKKIAGDLVGLTDARARSLKAERDILILNAKAEVEAAEERLRARQIEAGMVGGPGATVASSDETRRAAVEARANLLIQQSLAGAYPDAIDRSRGNVPRTATQSDYFDLNKAARDVAALSLKYDEQARIAVELATVQRQLDVAVSQGWMSQSKANEIAREASEQLYENTELRKSERRAVEEANKAILEEAQKRLDAFDAVEEQIKGLRNEADALKGTDRERAIRLELLKAEEKAVDGLTQRQRDLITLEAGRKFDNAAADKAKDKALADYQRDLVRATDRAVDFAADTFYDAFTGRIASIGEFLKQTLARAAAQGLAEAIFRPVVSSVIGSVFRPAAASGVSGGFFMPASGGGLSLSNGLGLANLGSTIYGGLGSFSTSLASSSGLIGGINSIGAASGLFAAAPAVGPGGLLAGGGVTSSGLASSGLLGATTLGQFAGGVGLGFGAGTLLNSLVGGHSTGGMIGSGAGALGGAVIGSMILPGVGTILGGLLGGAGGGLLGGLFGPNKSVGPNAGANIGFSGGRFVLGSAGADNGGDVAGAISFAQSAAEAINRFQKASGATFGGRPPAYQFGSFGGELFVGRNGGNENSIFTGSDPQAAIMAAVRDLAASGGLSLSGYAGTALRNSGAGTLDALLSDVQFAKGLERLNLSEVEQAVAGINEKYDEQIQRAKDLLLPTEKLIELRDKEIAQAKQAEATQRLGVERNAILASGQAGASILSFLDAQSLSGGSSLSPTARLAEAQRQFGALLAQVRGGDISAVSGLTGAAGNLLDIGRQNFASTVQFAGLESFVRSSLSSVGQSITSENYVADQVTRAIALADKAQADRDAALKEEVEGLRREFQLLRQRFDAAA